MRQTMACATARESLTCAWDKRVSLQTNSFECETRVLHTFNSASKTRLSFLSFATLDRPRHTQRRLVRGSGNRAVHRDHRRDDVSIARWEDHRAERVVRQPGPVPAAGPHRTSRDACIIGRRFLLRQVDGDSPSQSLKARERTSGFLYPSRSESSAMETSDDKR